ncbi:MAG: hypothetical protein JXB03_11065 [Spirochaetales bacterium]|nr:hypothetical protein [Spirochaetales bacterium]
MRFCPRHILFLLSLTAFIAGPAYSANLTVPLFELITRGFMEDGIVVLTTRGLVDLHIAGGYKFGGSVTLGFDSDNLDQAQNELETTASSSEIASYLNSVPFLQFKSAEVTIRDIGGVPLNFSYFTGHNAIFGNGDEFRRRFGTGPIGTMVRGFSYFPEGLIYDGLYQVNGTGFKLDSNFGRDSIHTEFYTYQDAYLGRGYFSSHVRSLYSRPDMKIETYAGVSYPVNPYGLYSAGMLIHYAPGSRASFLTQVGIPRFIPQTDTLSVEHIFFLFEPRLHFSAASLILTLFWHPEYYKEFVFLPYEESGSVDMNMNLQIGKPEITVVSGGIEGNVSFETAGERELTARVSPYVSLITDGVIWEMKLNGNVFPFEMDSLIEAFIGVRAEF